MIWIASSASILEHLGIGMVSQTALDYIHLVCHHKTILFINILSLWIKDSRDVKAEDEANENVSGFLLNIK